MKSHLRAIVSSGFVAALAGCASAASAPPTLQTGPNAEITVDGLHRVDNSILQLAYASPDMDLRPYTEFMLDPVTVAYKKDPQGRTRSTSVGAGESNFALSPSQMDRLKGIFQEEVVKAMTADSGYHITDAPGPNVLRVTAHLVDLIVKVPTDRGGRQRSFTRSYGEVTLILELRDSESGRILARVAERRDPTRDTSGGLAEVSSVFMRADATALFRYWAELMRQRLDDVRAMGTLR